MWIRRSCVIAAVALATPARADRPSPPCKACTLDVPTSKRPFPLLVVLHGDRGRATTASRRWIAAARTKGWAVLSLQCPVTEGCKDSWWQWNGDPSWVRAQIGEVVDAVEIDRTRIVLAGWSGGATYLGMRAAEWNADRKLPIAAVVIHGGGMAPDDDACPPHPLPAYFLVGDRNPLHRLAVDLRGYFERCHQPVVWDVVRGGDHAREDRALDRAKAAAILDWLAARPLTAARARSTRRAPAPPR